MGRKYIIEIGRLERLYKAFVSAHGKPEITWLSPEADLTPYTEPDLEQVRKEAYEKGRKDVETQFCSYDACKNRQEEYQRGLADAWEAARTLWNTPNRKEIFGHTTFSTTLTTLTAQETIEKIRQYEQEKEEQIQVGDEVATDAGNRASVLYEDPDGTQVFVFKSDGTAAWWTKSALHRTGRNFPEIATVLEKMRGEQDG